MRAKVYVDNGFQDATTARALTVEEIRRTVGDYGRAARNAKRAGFDGIEVHAQANHLLPQFLNESINQRQDAYGGSIENRSRLVLEIIAAVRAVWGPGRVGLKITPGVTGIGAMTATDTTLATYEYLVEKLNDYTLSHLTVMHMPGIDLRGTPLEALHGRVFQHFRNRFHGTLIVGGGFDFEGANDVIATGTADLVAFGRPFIANPDLVERFTQHLSLAGSDPATHYQGGRRGYTDYPPAASVA